MLKSNKGFTVIEVNPEQSLNALLPMAVTLAGMLIEDSLVQPPNA